MVKQTKKRILLAIWKAYCNKMYFLNPKIKSNFCAALKKAQQKKMEEKRKLTESKNIILVKRPSNLKNKIKLKGKIEISSKKKIFSIQERKKNKNKKDLRLKKRLFNWNFKKKKRLDRRKNFSKKRSRFDSIKKDGMFKYKVNIIVKANNVFCNFATFKENKTKKTCTAGKYNIKMSKKTARFVYNNVITTFFKKIKRNFYTKHKKDLEKFKKEKARNKKAWRFYLKPIKGSGSIITIIASSRKRRKILRNIKYHFKDLPLLIKVLDKKIFNGCRAPKKIRKKKRRMRILK